MGCGSSVTSSSGEKRSINNNSSSVPQSNQNQNLGLRSNSTHEAFFIGIGEIGCLSALNFLEKIYGENISGKVQSNNNYLSFTNKFFHENNDGSFDSRFLLADHGDIVSQLSCFNKEKNFHSLDDNRLQCYSDFEEVNARLHTFNHKLRKIAENTDFLSHFYILSNLNEGIGSIYIESLSDTLMAEYPKAYKIVTQTLNLNTSKPYEIINFLPNFKYVIDCSDIACYLDQNIAENLANQSGFGNGIQGISKIVGELLTDFTAPERFTSTCGSIPSICKKITPYPRIKHCSFGYSRSKSAEDGISNAFSESNNLLKISNQGKLYSSHFSIRSLYNFNTSSNYIAKQINGKKINFSPTGFNLSSAYTSVIGSSNFSCVKLDLNHGIYTMFDTIVQKYDLICGLHQGFDPKYFADFREALTILSEDYKESVVEYINDEEEE